MALVQLFIEICLFRKGPQDVPASWLLFWPALMTYLLVGVVLLGLEAGWGLGAIEALVEATLLLGFLWLLLWFFHKSERWLPVASSMLATDVVISVPAIPLLAWAMVSPEWHGVYLLLLALTVWHVAVVGHILRHALSQSWTVGLLWSIGYVVGSYQVMVRLFPVSISQ